jgi:hypothetical protein
MMLAAEDVLEHALRDLFLGCQKHRSIDLPNDFSGTNPHGRRRLRAAAEMRGQKALGKGPVLSTPPETDSMDALRDLRRLRYYAASTVAQKAD